MSHAAANKPILIVSDDGATKETISSTYQDVFRYPVTTITCEEASRLTTASLKQYGAVIFASPHATISPDASVTQGFEASTKLLEMLDKKISGAIPLYCFYEGVDDQTRTLQTNLKETNVVLIDRDVEESFPLANKVITEIKMSQSQRRG